jgi:predicted ATPase
MQQLEIKKFGPIENLNLAINDYLIFIGPQAVGKSTVSKAIFFFKSLRDDLLKYILESVEKGELFKPIGTYAKFIRKKFLEFWGPTFHPDDIYICYHYEESFWVSITLEKNGKYVSPTFSDNFKKRLEDIFHKADDFIKLKNRRNRSFLSSKDMLETEAEKRSFFSEVQEMSNQLFNENKDLMFIPAGRSLLATLSDQLQYIHPYKLDYLMRSFVDRINSTKSIFNKGLDDIVEERKKFTHEVIQFEKVNYAKKLIEKILKGAYHFDREGEKIYFDRDRYVKLNYSSSGQQESIWILLIVFLLILENRDVFIVIEEPEAHLYPEAQKELVDLIFLLGNMKKNQVVITTHSPYILASLNNLIYANNIGKQHKEKVAQKIHPLLWVDSDKVGAYFIDKHIFRDILDKEIQSIETEAIDSASRIINNDYDYLFNLE